MPEHNSDGSFNVFGEVREHVFSLEPHAHGHYMSGFVACSMRKMPVTSWNTRSAEEITTVAKCDRGCWGIDRLRRPWPWLGLGGSRCHAAAAWLLLYHQVDMPPSSSHKKSPFDIPKPRKASEFLTLDLEVQLESCQSRLGTRKRLLLASIETLARFESEPSNRKETNQERLERLINKRDCLSWITKV